MLWVVWSFYYINSPNLRAWDTFPFLQLILHFSDQCFIVFSVQVFHRLGLVTKLCSTPVIPWSVAHQAPVCGILQARILKWVAISFSRGSSQCRSQTWVSCVADSLPTKLRGKSFISLVKFILKFFLLDAILNRTFLETSSFCYFIVNIKKYNRFLYINLVSCYFSEFIYYL